MPLTSPASPDTQAVEAADRAHQEGRGLLADAAQAALGVVEDQGGDAVHHLAARDAADAGRDHVVERHRVRLAAALPDERPRDRHRRRAPEADAVRARRVVVHGAVHGVDQLVGLELVVVVGEAFLEVGPEAARADLVEVRVAHVLVEHRSAPVDREHLGRGPAPAASARPRRRDRLRAAAGAAASAWPGRAASAFARDPGASPNTAARRGPGARPIRSRSPRPAGRAATCRRTRSCRTSRRRRRRARASCRATARTRPAA